MDAYEFFHEIVVPNCEEALRPPYELRLAWNAIVSLNTVLEFVALDRLGYRDDVDRDLLGAKAQEIRQNNLALVTVNKQANKLKHVRRLPRNKNEALSSVNTSTSHKISEPTPGELIKAIVDALQTFRDAQKFPELSALNRT